MCIAVGTALVDFPPDRQGVKVCYLTELHSHEVDEWPVVAGATDSRLGYGRTTGANGDTQEGDWPAARRACLGCRVGAHSRKRNRMTILVGIVGSDGILLATDRRRTIPAQNEQQFDDHADIYKIKFLEKHKVAYAGVGDGATKAVGRRLSEWLTDGRFDFSSFEAIEISLMTIADETTREEIKKSPTPAHFDDSLNRSLLGVFYGGQVPEPQLWMSKSFADLQMRTALVARQSIGAIGNRARFFDAYLRGNLPVERLIFLASHIVLTAHRFDKQFISGLDVAIFQKSHYHELTEKEKARLRQRSERLDKLIQTELSLE